MKPSVLLNDLLTKGAILGIVMLIADIIDISIVAYTQSIAWFTFRTIILLIFFVINIFLLYRFTRSFANKVVTEREGMPYFTYGNGLAYIVYLSALSGIVASFGSWVFLHHIVGYENYVNRLIEMMQFIFNDIRSTSEMTAQLTALFNELGGKLNEMFSELKNSSEPTAIDTILNSVLLYMIRGGVIGLIMAAFTIRKPIRIEGKDE